MELRFDSSAGGKFQMPSAIFIQSPVVCFSVGGTGSNGFWFDCISRYCVIQWVEEHGSCIVKGHNLPYWLMTPDVKRILVSQGVSAFARAICAMLRCHERRKDAVAQLQKCSAVSKVSSTSVTPPFPPHPVHLPSRAHFQHTPQLMDCIHVVSPAASARIFFDSLSGDGPSRASVVTADGVAMAFATTHSPLHCPDNRIGTCGSCVGCNDSILMHCARRLLQCKSGTAVHCKL